MDNGIEIGELIHTISHLRRTQEYRPAPPPHSSTEHKHLSLLDGLALLLVMGEKSDVVVVTYRQTTTHITIYYSANCHDPKRQDHINEIAHKITNIVPNQKVSMVITDILLICLENCSKKIKQRVRKLWKAFTELASWIMPQGNMDEFVLSICGPGADYPKALAFFKLLQQLTGNVSGSMQHEGNMSHIMYEIMYKSYHVGKVQDLCALPHLATLKRRIRKLGDYYGAAQRLCIICATPEVNKYPPTTPQKLKIRDPLTVINSYMTEADVIITKDEFQRAFPDPSLPTKPKMVTTSQHCEVTIALRARAISSPLDPPIEIGISKHSCWLCQVFFKCLKSELGQKLGITGNQGKVHAGWHYPVEAGYATRNALLKILHKGIGELRGIANPRKRSDSFPVSSPEGYGEHSDSEEQSTKEEFAALYASRAAKKLALQNSQGSLS